MTSRKDPSVFARQIADSTQQYLTLLKRQNETLQNLVANLRRDDGPCAIDESPCDDLQEALGAAEREATRLQELVATLRAELGRHQHSRAALEHQLADLEHENRTYAQRFAGLEQQVAQLSSLFTATFRIHEATTPAELHEILDEIVVNMLGCEELGIYEPTGQGGELALVHSRGLAADAPRKIRLGQGRIGECAQGGQLYLCDRHGAGEGSECELTACVPLKRRDSVLGVVALFHLLPHKGRLEGIDEELMEVIGNDGGSALHAARLQQRVAAEAA